VPEGVRFRWLGVAGVEIRAQGCTLAIDPYLTRIPFRSLWFGRVRSSAELVARHLPQCDFLLLGHAHFDHILDAPALLRQTGALALGSANSCRLLSVCGVPPERIRQVNPGDRLELFDLGLPLAGERERGRGDGLRLEVYPVAPHSLPGFRPGPLAPHLRPPLRARDYRMDRVLAYLLEVGEQRLLFDLPEGRLPPGPIDVLFAPPLPGGRAQDDERLAAVLAALRPRLFVPIHWDDMWQPLAQPVRPLLAPTGKLWPPLARLDLAEFARTVRRLSPQTAVQTSVLIPERLREYDLAALLARSR
jgi:L-ascorbate metabolism protein UlaG (beta-lactamase superfamily)